MNKYLIIRFSSFGDIVQAMPVAGELRRLDPHAQIHWVTRSDFSQFVGHLKTVDRAWALERSHGLKGLFKLCLDLRKENFTHLYDAHNNLRSFLILSFLRLTQPGLKVIRRSKMRFQRMLLFKFRINKFPQPFRGAESYITPLKKWFPLAKLNHPLHFNLDKIALPHLQNFKIEDSVILAPGATWELKKWPTNYWIELVHLFKQQKFIVLGGAEDQFCDEIAKACPGQVLNLKGQLSWLQSTKCVFLAKAVVSGDTGILHVADLLGKNTIALIGPTAFGYPSALRSRVLEVELPCKPCSKDGRGKCVNKTYKKCMLDITPHQVAETLRTVHQ